MELDFNISLELWDAHYSGNVKKQTSLKFSRVIIIPMLSCWALTKEQKRRMEKAELYFLWNNKHNEEELGIIEMNTVINLSKEMVWTHKKMPENRIPMLLYQYTPNGRWC